MAKQKDGVNKSEEIRKLLQTNPKLPVKDLVASLADRGITVTPNLVYFIKGQTAGNNSRRRKARQMVARVTATGNGDAVATIVRVKGLAAEVGGLKKLKVLVEA